MLRPPYQSYDRLHVYHLDMAEIPAFNDPDLIGIWIEDKTAVLFFHQAKDSLVADLCSRHRCNLVYHHADLEYWTWAQEQGCSVLPQPALAQKKSQPLTTTPLPVKSPRRTVD